MVQKTNYYSYWLANHEKSHIVKIWNNGLEEEIQVELDSIKQEPKQWVLTYYDRMEKLFTRGKLENVKHKKRFLFQLCLEIKKLCVMRDYANMEGMFTIH